MNWIERITATLGLSVKRAGVSNSQPAVYASASADGRPISSNWSAEKAVSEGLKVNAWVYAAVSMIASSLASVPLVLERQQGDGWELDSTHDIQALLNRPNPFMGRQDLSERWAQHMMLAGNALFWLNIVGGKPVELWPIQPDTIKPIQSRAEFIGGYEWKVDSSTKRLLPVAEVAHWMFPDPSDTRWGLSPLQAGAASVDMDQAAARWNRAVLANDGKPPLAVFLNETLSFDQMRQASGLIRDQIDGGSVRKALVLGGASKVQPLSLNATDLDFLNGRKYSREEIAAVFGVPAILLSFGEAATYANLDAANTKLWEDRIVPLIDKLCQGYMGALFPFWGLTEAQYRIRADLSGVRALQANLKTEAEVGKLRAETFTALVNAGVPANMAAQTAQLPLTDIPGGDAPKAAQATAPPAAKAARPRFERKDRGEDSIDAQLARMDEWTDEARKRVAALLIEQGNAVAAAYASGKPWEQALSIDDWEALMRAIHTAVLEAEGAVAFTSLLAATTAAGGGGAFDVLADNVVEWIDDHVGTLVKGIDETSRVAVAAQIKAGVEAGESQRDIAKRLRSLHEDWSDYRANTIARTEVASAFGQAHQASAEQIAEQHDVQLVKVWLATRDSRTRDEHAAIDGERVALDEAFSIGVQAPPGGVNCRCVVLYEEGG